jgi:hypothetical protein
MNSARPSPPADAIAYGPPRRAAVWGTGHLGVELIRACVRRGDVDPVAAIVTDPAKHGRDLGDIAGLGFTLGAEASTDVDAVLARDDIDVVFYTGIGESKDIAASLEKAVRAGKDAVTYCAVAHPATALGPGGAEALDAAARETGKHVLCTGFGPGFLTDVLPVVLASCSVDWNSLSVRLVAPMDTFGGLLLDAYGVGQPPGEHTPVESRLSFMESLGIIVESLSVEVAESKEQWEPIISDRRRTGGARDVEAGMVTGVRRLFTARTTAGRTITIEIIFMYMLDPERDAMQEEYVVDVVGGGPGAGARASLTGGWSPDAYPATAASGLNALPGLLSLPPGLYNPAQVPFAVRRPGWRSVRAGA